MPDAERGRRRSQAHRHRGPGHRHRAAGRAGPDRTDRQATAGEGSRLPRRRLRHRCHAPTAPARLPRLRASLRLWLRSLPVWQGTEGRELPQRRPFQDRLGDRNPGPVPGHDHPKRPGPDGAPDRRWQHDRLAVDADGISGASASTVTSSLDGDLIGGGHGQPRAVPAATSTAAWRALSTPDGDHAQGAGVEPDALAKAGHVAHLIGVVADQQGLRPRSWCHRPGRSAGRRGGP